MASTSIGLAEADLLAAVPRGLLIDGRWRGSSSGTTFAVENPATGIELTQVADATADDATAALDAATAAQEQWARTDPRERGEVLRRGYEALVARTEDLARLMTLEMGKSLTEARSEVAYSADFLRWFSEEAVRAYGRYVTAPSGRTRLMVARKPVGPCLLITPWNFPLAMAARKVAPALAAGCTAILKPAKLTPLTSALFAALLIEAGIPKGVLNLLPTTRADEIANRLLDDGRLRKLSFTGSTPVGRRLLKRAAPGVLRTSMELGGNAPFLVFADADLDAAVEGAMVAKMRNIGEACTAANRFLVQENVMDAFCAKLTAAMVALTVGCGMTDKPVVGPLIDERSRQSVHGMVEEAVAGGATLLSGGAYVPGPGYFYQPTVLRDPAPDARVLREEIFGPVAPVISFAGEDEAIRLANDTEYGLAAYIYTRDLARGFRVSERLETGMLGINTGAISNPAAPFGGVKQSGLGREGGTEGIAEYLETQYIAVADPFAAMVR